MISPRAEIWIVIRKREKFRALFTATRLEVVG